MKKIFLAILLFVGIAAQAQNNEKQTIVVIKTSYGDIKAVLYNETPQHRDNFIKLINEGWYDGSPFHRVINHFMIQGGGKAGGPESPDYTIPAEIVPKYYHKKGALAAARLGDFVNPEKASSGSQFYIVQGKPISMKEINYFSMQMGKSFTKEMIETYQTIGGTPHLDGDYTVFGEVIEGLDIVDKIAAVQTNNTVPVTPVTMTIEIVK